jgi:hypothetical protein
MIEQINAMGSQLLGPTLWLVVWSLDQDRRQWCCP